MRYEIEGKLLSDIGDAIRENTGKSELILPGDMPNNIRSISESHLFVNKNIIHASGDILCEFHYQGFQQQMVRGLGIIERASCPFIPYVDLGDINTSATIYSVIRAEFDYGDYAGISAYYSSSFGNVPNIFTRNSTWHISVYGASSDRITNYSSRVFRVLSISFDNETKTTRYFIDTSKIGELRYKTSGRYASFGGNVTSPTTLQSSNDFTIKYGAVVRGSETDDEIISNMSLIANEYLDIIDK